MTEPSLEQRLEAHRDAMTPAALRVARFLAEHPERAVVATAAEIAVAARTSDATVVRTVKTLGYAGLPELRRGVGAEWAVSRDPREALEERVSRVNSAPAAVLDAVLDDAMGILAETRAQIDHDAFVAAVELLAGPGHILVLGWGPAGTLADYIALNLARLGCDADSESSGGFRLADGLLRVRAGDVVLVLAPLQYFRELDVTLTRAAEMGARVILVTELLGERLKDRVDFVLTTASSRRRTATHSIGLLTVLDALLLGVAAAHSDRAVDTWNTLTALRDSLDGDIAPPVVPGVHGTTGVPTQE